MRSWVVMQLAIDFSACSWASVPESSTSSPRASSTRPPEVYTRDEVQQMLDGPLGRNERTRTRNRALLVVMWRAGLRVSEALGLRMDDLRPDEGGVWVRRGKGGKPRLAGMDPESFEAPGTLQLHADRGAVPKGKTVKQLLCDLDVTPSFSRPRVSNDNPFSEAEFRTMKYGPDYPDRFGGYEHARDFCRQFFSWYNNEHRHSGIAYFTPADVHYDRVPEVLARRQAVMDQAFARTPGRFPRGAPRVPAPPKAVWINPPENRAEIELGLPGPSAR